MIISQYIDPFIIPLSLLFCGALAKKLVRGKGWERSDFYLGIELVLLSLGSAVLYLYDISFIIQTEKTTELSMKILYISVFFITSFFLWLCVLSLHQDWQMRTENTTKQFFLLIIVCNSIGIGLFAVFIFLIKGV